MKTHLIAFAIGIVALVGCAGTRDDGPDSPYYRYPGGSRLSLNQPLDIPAAYATARLQFGRLVPFGAVQEQEPHCIFEIDTVRPGPQRVEPDTFAIVQVRRSTSAIAGLSAPALRVRYVEDTRPSQMFYKTEFVLRSERQPQVRRLTCQHDQYAAGVGIPRHLTLAEIRSALGSLFTLQLPGGAI